LARIDEVAQRTFDVIERAEPQCPLTEQSRQVRCNGSPEREPFLELCRVENCPAALPVNVIGTVALDGIRHQVRRQLAHPGPGVLAPLFVKMDGKALVGLQQRRDYETDGACAQHVDSDPGRQAPGLWKTGWIWHWRPRRSYRKHGSEKKSRFRGRGPATA